MYGTVHMVMGRSTLRRTAFNHVARMLIHPITPTPYTANINVCINHAILMLGKQYPDVLSRAFPFCALKISSTFLSNARRFCRKVEVPEIIRDFREVTKLFRQKLPVFVLAWSLHETT